MKKLLLIVLLIVGCKERGVDTDSSSSSCILIVNENFQICTEGLNEAECYSYYTFHNTFWSNTSSCSELNYSTEFDPCLNLEDTYQEITHCDIDWYLNNDIGKNGWICTTAYPFDIQDSPIDTTQVYESLEACKQVCPSEPIAITTVASPDGTGEYYSMYCTGK